MEKPKRWATRPTAGVLNEGLEPRVLMSASIAGVMSVVNVSHQAGQQAEQSIAVDPSTGGMRVFVGANESAMSQFAGTSSDGGVTFVRREFADGADGLPAACCDPSAAFDTFGNLYFTYLDQNRHDTHVLLSTDGGQSFSLIGSFDDDGDQPTVATGPRSVWLTFGAEGDKDQEAEGGDDMTMAAAGESETRSGAGGAKRAGGLVYAAVVNGAGDVEPFGKAMQVGQGLGIKNVGDIAVGPGGQALVAYQTPNNNGPSDIYVQLDADGTGKKTFGKPVKVGSTNVGDFDVIPAQSRRTIDAAVGLAYDRSGGPFTGRVYMAYTDETTNESSDTDVLLRFSDNDGITWSDPVRVNDDSSGRSQFLPRIAVDPTTGTVGISWHDARNDSGDSDSGGGTNAISNDDAQLFATVATPTRDGVTISPNVQVSPGFSNAATSDSPLDYGDYAGLAFHSGTLMPAWADNSNSTGDNPDGALAAFDVYGARVAVTNTDPAPTRTVLGQFGNVGTTGKRFMLTDDDGTRVTVTLSGGTATVFRNGSAIDLRVIDAGNGASLRITAVGGNGRLTLGNVDVTGSLRRFTGRTADLAGAFSATGTIRTLALGDVSGKITTAGGDLRSLSVSSLNDALVLSGADLAANTFAAGSIGKLRVTGSIMGSLVGAGLDPVNGDFGDDDDVAVGGASSAINSITTRGEVDASTRFVAGAFGRARIPKPVDIASDPRFRTL
jgi:hypothetical protein